MNPYGGLPTQQQAAEQQQKAQQQEEMRQELLKKILSPEALTRLGTLAVAKPEKVRARFKFLAPVHTCGTLSSCSVYVAVQQARQLEEMVLMMAQKGQVKEQITDGQFKQMLEGMSGSDNQPKMTYTRRGGFDDDDDSASDLIDLESPIAQRPAKTCSRARGFVVRSGRFARRPVSLQKCWHARALMSNGTLWAVGRAAAYAADARFVGRPRQRAWHPNVNAWPLALAYKHASRTARL